MTDIEKIGFLHVAYWDFHDLLTQTGHPDPVIGAHGMVNKLQNALNYYQSLWDSRK